MGKRAKPFLLTHLDLDRALAACRLTPVEQIVMQHMREHSYGEARRRNLESALPVKLNRHELSRISGIDRSVIVKAIARMVADNLLIEADDGHRINKRFQEWTGGHALTDQSLAYAMGVMWTSPPGGDVDLTPGGDVDLTRGVAQTSPPGVMWTSPPNTSPPTPPHSRARASEDSSERFKKTSEERAESAPACETDAIDSLASEIVGRIWGLTEDGEPDSITVYSVASSLRSVGPGLDPAHVRAVACKCAAKASPASYFFGIARTGGLRPDPIRDPPPRVDREAARKAERLASAERLRIKLMAELDEEDQPRACR